MIEGVKKAMQHPRLLTLLTDFGIEDSYVGQMKGVLYSINPDIKLIDLTHSISSGDVFGAAFVLKTCYRAFPGGTIHLVVVDPGVGGERKPIVVSTAEYLFVGPDNGVFSYIYSENRFEIYSISNQDYIAESVSHTFHGRDIFAPVCGHLSLGAKVETVGRRMAEPVRVTLPQPKIEEKDLLGEVIHIDPFGNLVTDISKECFEEFPQDEEVFVEIRGTRIDGMSQSYVEKDKILAIFGSSRLLEISLSRGRADEFLGVKTGEPVVVRIREKEKAP